MSIDWVREYEKKFESNYMISTLKQSRFHGKLVINFCDGSPNTTHVEWCVRPYMEVEHKPMVEVEK